MTSKTWFSWPRLLCVLVTTGFLWFVLRDLHIGEVWGVMRRTNPWAFLAALVTYQVALILAAYVWHVTLRAVRCAAHVMATNRFALIGHFFFVALFGAFGCDLAKSGVYARWYRFGLPEVLAAAPLERGLRGIGSLILGVIVIAMGAFSGGGKILSRLRLSFSPVWAMAVLGACAVLIVLARYCKPTGEGFIARLRRALRAGVAGLFSDPTLAARGVVAAVLAQAAASAVFAISLAGITGEHLPWAKMAWTFPTIVVVSCLPFTVAGTGVREVAAVLFLGIYGVPKVEAIAASLITLVQKLFLAAIGAASWWREETLLRRDHSLEVAPNISVVIPTLNEASNIADTVRAVQAVPEVCEIILVDGGSRDDTVRIAENLGCVTMRGAPGRGRQLRVGAERAKGDILLFLHADTLVPAHTGKAILSCLRDVTVAGGGFWKRFAHTPLPLLGARFKCLVRLVWSRRIFGDQGMFVRRAILEQAGGVPDLPLMEDVELCRRLRKIGRLALADATVIASERRFRRVGYLRTTWLTWKISILYRLGKSPEELAAMYRPPAEVSAPQPTGAAGARPIVLRDP